MTKKKKMIENTILQALLLQDLDFQKLKSPLSKSSVIKVSITLILNA
jgi:hypothetical protein